MAARGCRSPAWTPAKPGPDEGLCEDAASRARARARARRFAGCLSPRTGGRRPCASLLHSPACWTCPGCGSRRSASSPAGSWSGSRCAASGCAARSAPTRRWRARTCRITTRSGGLWISASGGLRSAAGCGGCAARSTARMWRACRSPVTAPGSRATSRMSWPGLRPRPTRPRSAGCCGSTGRPSGGSSSVSARSCCPPTGSRACSRSRSTRSRGARATTI